MKMSYRLVSPSAIGDGPDAPTAQPLPGHTAPLRRGVLQPSERGGSAAAYVGDTGWKAGGRMETDAKGRATALELAAEQANAAGRKVVIFSLATAIGPEDAVQRLIRAVQRVIARSWKTVIQDLAAKLRFNVTISPSAEAGGMPEITLGLEPGASATHSGLFTDALDPWRPSWCGDGCGSAWVSTSFSDSSSGAERTSNGRSRPPSRSTPTSRMSWPARPAADMRRWCPTRTAPSGRRSRHEHGADRFQGV